MSSRSKTHRLATDTNEQVISTNAQVSPYYMSIQHSRIKLIVLPIHMQWIVDLYRPVRLGRTVEDSLADVTHLDLTPYGADNLGVSRRHALLEIQQNRLIVMDLNSVNGTSVNRVRLQPNAPYQLMHGDILELGDLQLRIGLLNSG
jgi:hypothetical protein